jgi:hypothetical protein
MASSPLDAPEEERPPAALTVRSGVRWSF